MMQSRRQGLQGPLRVLPPGRRARACRASIRRWPTTRRSRCATRSTRSASCSTAASRRAPKATRGPYGMPPFYQELSDEEVAAVVTYIASRGATARRRPGVRSAALARRAGGSRAARTGRRQTFPSSAARPLNREAQRDTAATMSASAACGIGFCTRRHIRCRAPSAIVDVRAGAHQQRPLAARFGMKPACEFVAVHHRHAAIAEDERMPVRAPRCRPSSALPATSTTQPNCSSPALISICCTGSSSTTSTRSGGNDRWRRAARHRQLDARCVPAPSSLFSSIVPPISCTRRLHSVRPSPVPSERR